jgi:hypothetical protein
MMLGEVLSQQCWLWPLAWQSSAVLAVGLGGSLILRHRPVRAHRLLLLALLAAVTVPVVNTSGKAGGLECEPLKADCLGAACGGGQSNICI